MLQRFLARLQSWLKRKPFRFRATTAYSDVDEFRRMDYSDNAESRLRDVPALFSLVRENDPGRKASAIARLGHLYRLQGLGQARTSQKAIEIERALPDFIAAIGHAHPSVRLEALEIVGMMGPIAREAVPILVEASKDSEALVRTAAIRNLPLVCLNEDQVLEVCRLAIDDPHPIVRSAAADALGGLGSLPDSMLERLGHLLDDDKVSRAAASALFRAGERALPIISQAAERQRDHRIAGWLESLYPEGRRSEFLLPFLIALLGNEDPSVRLSSLHSLAGIGPFAHSAVLEVCRLLQDSDGWVRRSAVTTLAAIGAHREEAASAVVEMLARADGDLRTVVAGEVGKFGLLARSAVPELTKMLSRGSWDHWAAAVTSLREIGPEAAPAVPELVSALFVEDRQFFAVMALGSIGPSASTSIPKLRDMLNHPNATIRVETASALWRIGDRGGDLAEILRDLLAECELDVQIRAARALADFGPAASPALAVLVKAVANQCGDLSAIAVHAIGRIGSAAREAVPALLSALEHADSKTRLNLAVALWQITGQSELPVAVLAELLDPAKPRSDSYYDEGVVRVLGGAMDPGMRAQVARALGEIGPPARSVLPALHAAGSDGDDALRAATHDAIEKITAAPK